MSVEGPISAKALPLQLMWLTKGMADMQPLILGSPGEVNIIETQLDGELGIPYLVEHTVELEPNLISPMPAHLASFHLKCAQHLQRQLYVMISNLE